MTMFNTYTKSNKCISTVTDTFVNSAAGLVDSSDWYEPSKPLIKQFEVRLFISVAHHN